MTKVLVEDKTSSQSPLYSILSTQFSCSLGRVTMPNKFSLFLPLFPANTPLNGYYNLHVLANLYLFALVLLVHRKIFLSPQFRLLPPSQSHWIDQGAVFYHEYTY